MNRVREHRRRQPDDHRGRRLRAAERAGGRRGRGLPVPPEPRGRGQLHHRRQPRHQRRRHAGAALRQRARPVPGAGSRHRAGRGLGRPVGPAQGQHRLRPARPVHRQRRHAGRHHRRHHEAVPAAARAPDRLGRRALDGSRARAAGTGAQAPGRGLTGFEVMGQFALGLVAKHFPQMRVPLSSRQSPYCVLLENADQESEPMRARSSSACWRRRWRTAASPTRWWPRTSRRRARCGTCANPSRWPRPRKA